MHGFDHFVFRTGVDNTGARACLPGRTPRSDSSGRFLVFDLPGSGFLLQLTRP